jgi:hypothetical protein
MGRRGGTTHGYSRGQALTDRVNRRLVYALAAVAGGVWPFVFFLSIGGGSLGLLVLGVSSACSATRSCTGRRPRS